MNFDEHVHYINMYCKPAIKLLILIKDGDENVLSLGWSPKSLFAEEQVASASSNLRNQ